VAINKDQIIEQVVKFLVGYLSKGHPMSVSLSVPLDPQPPAQPAPPVMDWVSPDSKVTEHFTVSDACMLHSWNRLANDMDGFTDDMKTKLIALCQKMEEVRTFLGCPINVHCMFRSAQYNIEQKILLPTGMDVHAMGLAVDFDCAPHMTIDQIKAKIEPQLESMGIRMEKGTTTWVHLDLHAPGPSGRYFTA
jgi:hypothetical protein